MSLQPFIKGYLKFIIFFGKSNKMVIVRYLVNFFYYESFLGLLVKWKVQQGGVILKNLKYIFES